MLKNAPFRSLTKFLTQIFYVGAARLALNAPTPRQSLAEPDVWPGSVACLPAGTARIGKLGPACCPPAGRAGTGRPRPRTVPIRPKLRLYGGATFAKMGAQKFRNVRSRDIFQHILIAPFCTGHTARSRPKPRVKEQILRSITIADHNHCQGCSNGCVPGQCDHLQQPYNLGRIGCAT
jgi:hypothetical protein